MTDALCGPSNALQNFQKHTSVDKSLQQDRLVTRGNHAQGFRSGHGMQSGLLDHEFEAFQAGHPSSSAFELNQHSHRQQQSSQYSTLASRQFPHTLSSGSTGWASDFQRLKISQPHHPLPLKQQQISQIQQTPDSWYQDFRSHMAQHNQPFLPQTQQSITQQNYAFASTPGLSHSPPYSASTSSLLTLSPVSQWKGKEKAVVEDANMEAFEREFEARTTELLQDQERELDSHEPLTLDTSPEEKHFEILTDEEQRASIPNMELEKQKFQPAVDEMKEDILEERDGLVPDYARHPRVDYLNALDELTDMGIDDETHLPPPTHDDIAITASYLLDAVSDNTTEKFKQSHFLSLMRQFRDYEVRVEGDKIVDNDDSRRDLNNSNTSSILPHERDDDPGRDKFQMAGALQPSQPS